MRMGPNVKMNGPGGQQFQGGPGGMGVPGGPGGMGGPGGPGGQGAPSKLAFLLLNIIDFYIAIIL